MTEHATSSTSRQTLSREEYVRLEALKIVTSLPVPVHMTADQAIWNADKIVQYIRKGEKP